MVRTFALQVFFCTAFSSSGATLLVPAHMIAQAKKKIVAKRQSKDQLRTKQFQDSSKSFTLAVTVTGLT
jgi:hypothetical protein